MKKVQKVKGLQSQISKLQAECEVIKKEIEIKNEELKQKTKVINDIKSEIIKLQTKGELKITEHALVRYLERVEKLDIKEIENKIINDNVKTLVAKFKQGTFPSGQGFSVVVKDNVIVTIQ